MVNQQISTKYFTTVSNSPESRLSKSCSLNQSIICYICEQKKYVFADLRKFQSAKKLLQQIHKFQICHKKDWVRRPQTSKVSQLHKIRKSLTQFKSSNLEICDLWNLQTDHFCQQPEQKRPFVILRRVSFMLFTPEKKYKAIFCVNWRTSMCFFSKANWQAKTREKACIYFTGGKKRRRLLV